MENIANNLYLVCGILAFLGLLYLGAVIFQMIKGERKFRMTAKKGYNYFLGFLVLTPVIACLYFIPLAFYDENFWLDPEGQFAASQSALWFLGIFAYGFYAIIRLSIFMPHEKEKYNIIPQLLLVSLFPGIANALNVMIISEFITEDIYAGYLLFFFIVTSFVYVVLARLTRRQTANLGILIAHEMNMDITNKMLRIPYQKYEKINRGRIYTVLNADINAIYAFTQDFISIYTASITVILIMVYMYSLNLISSLILLGVTLLILSFLVLTSKPLKRKTHMERLQREKYTNLISGLINGFKELILHKIKRDRFQQDLEISSQQAYNASKARTNVSINFGLFAELSFTIAIGISCLVFPLIFEFDKSVTTAYVLAVLFLSGPVGVLINGVTLITNAQVSLKRIKAFIKDTDNIKQEKYIERRTDQVLPMVKKITVDNVHFDYDNEDEGITYGIGPINFEVNQGELVFIVGGNGSGKTTFLKILIGLYVPSSGRILIDDKETTNKQLGEYFSVIYSDFYLFKKIYDIKAHRLNQVYEWLEVLQLSNKVKIEDGVFSTINLSKGQRKRLAILKSYLEDRPVYFFDEVAADLDPGFRNFFYNELLIKMREEGKILIIISHDDKYFDLADSIYKMEMGKMSILNKELFRLSEHF